MEPHLFRGALVAVVGLALVSCSSPGVGGKSTSDLSDVVSANFSSCVVLDLDTGVLEQKATIPDLLTNPEYKSTKMVFRRVPTFASTFGAVNSESLANTDEFARYGRRSVGEFLIGVFEVTQEQWSHLAPSTPWVGIPTTIVPATTGTGIPAYNLSAAQVIQAITVSGLPLRLPSGDEWEAAARAGGSTLFTWGEEISGAQPTSQAVTVGAATFVAVGSKAANALGLYDIHGNAWELADDGDIFARGGSWLDPISQSRCANQAAIPFNASHPLAGVRLVLDQ